MSVSGKERKCVFRSNRTHDRSGIRNPGHGRVDSENTVAREFNFRFVQLDFQDLKGRKRRERGWPREPWIFVMEMEY